MMWCCRPCVEACPVFRGVAREVMYEVMELLMGSPLAMLRLHRCLLVEAVLALVMLSAQIVIFLVSFPSVDPKEMRMLIFLVLVPMIVSAFRLPLLVRMQQRCRQLAQQIDNQNAAIATGMVQLLSSRRSKRVQGISVFLICWYAFGVSWNYIGKPCRDITEPIKFWKMKPESLPCESWEMICTLLFLANGALGGMLCVAPKAVGIYQGHFLPSQTRGIPVHLLPRCLPEQVLGTPGAPTFADSDPTCSICIEVFRDGESVRQLPCGHCFHTACGDAWLTRSATCPMRCRTDLWGLVHAEQLDAPLVSRPEEETIGFSVSGPLVTIA